MVSAPAVLDVAKGTDSRLFAYRNRRPSGIVVHSTAGRSSLHYLQAGVLAEGRIASADSLIARDGTIYVLVPFDCHSYHAGVARYVPPTGIAITNINELFLGVELEALVTEPITPAQYYSLAGYILNKALAFTWPVPYCILAHSAVALPLGRRSDPVGFDWGRLYYELDRNLAADWWKG